VGGVSSASAVVRRLGILGGTFDPPHYGHLVLAENARTQLSLDRVLFVLAGQPPHKHSRPIAAAQHRLSMVEAAISDNAFFVTSRVDLDRPGPHYTVDMLALLHDEYPQAELYFLMGGDSLTEFPHWYNAPGILDQTRLAVMPRPGYDPDLIVLERVLPGIRKHVAWLDVPYLDIASTELRQRVHKGLPLRYIVPSAVDRYVREHELYTGESV